MHLYNTLTRKTENFQPHKKNQVGLYACGFTVYDYTHLGHLRKYTMDDVLIRVLRHADYQVKFVQNVTDVGHLTSDADTGEDKLEKGAKKYQKTVWDIAKEFEKYFFDSMDQMGNLRPDVSCRATEHIEAQINLVKKLEDKGFTYVIPDDGVYFDTSKFPSYCELAQLKIKDLKAGARVEQVVGKRNSTDFALWKFERPGENRAMSWPSPWAKRGFPGWHIECSAMAMQYLGDQLDIHTGGIDHIPVHHTNEIAQAEAATGNKPFVKYWVHHNFLRIDGEKMSKSLNNFFTIDDVLKKGFDPMALRLLFLMSHYRDEMNFTWDSLQAAQTSFDKLIEKIADWQKQLVKIKPVELSTPAQELTHKFWQFMEDDLQTSQAVAVMFETVKADLTLAEKMNLILDFDQVLGLQLLERSKKFQPHLALTKDQLPSDVVELLAKRQNARLAKDYKSADTLRQKLAGLGYSVRDEKGGQVVGREFSR